MGDQAGETVQHLLTAFREGDRQAGGRLAEQLYPELRRLAAVHLKGERCDHSWQPTVLVNELYLELIKVSALRPSDANRQNDRAAFFGLAAQIMRRLLIQHSRPLAFKAQKTPSFEEVCVEAESGAVAIEQLLTRLAEIKPELRTVVEMKVFEGLTAQEIASRLGCATVTANRYWQFARHWLQRELAA